MTTPLDDRLGQVFDAIHEEARGLLTPRDYDRLRFDFVFHMTDWLDDLRRLDALRRDPASVSLDEAKATVIGALLHATPHLLAAARILVGGVDDTFANDESARIVAHLESLDRPAADEDDDTKPEGASHLATQSQSH